MNRPVKLSHLNGEEPNLPGKFTHLDQYSGKTLLLRANNKLWGVRNDPTLGWSRWLKEGLEIIGIPGDHEAILFGPRAKKVAEIIQAQLDQAS
jgi:thioesterase domain-containing protein